MSEQGRALLWSCRRTSETLYRGVARARCEDCARVAVAQALTSTASTNTREHVHTHKREDAWVSSNLVSVEAARSDERLDGIDLLQHKGCCCCGRSWCTRCRRGDRWTMRVLCGPLLLRLLLWMLWMHSAPCQLSLKAVLLVRDPLLLRLSYQRVQVCDSVVVVVARTHCLAVMIRIMTLVVTSAPCRRIVVALLVRCWSK